MRFETGIRPLSIHEMELTTIPVGKLNWNERKMNLLNCYGRFSHFQGSQKQKLSLLGKLLKWLMETSNNYNINNLM